VTSSLPAARRTIWAAEQNRYRKTAWRISRSRSVIGPGRPASGRGNLENFGVAIANRPLVQVVSLSARVGPDRYRTLGVNFGTGAAARNRPATPASAATVCSPVDPRGVGLVVQLGQRCRRLGEPVDQISW